MNNLSFNTVSLVSLDDIKKELQSLEDSKATQIVDVPTKKNILYKQTSEVFENIFSKFQTGFRKGFSAQNCFKHYD